MVLTQKETTLLEDLKSQEQLCVEKYEKYATDACDGELKNLFTQMGQTERTHLDTVTKILGGTAPQVSSSSQTSVATGRVLGREACCSGENVTPNEHDKFLCQDSLASEKHVSSVYNTSIFEFKDVAVRDALNHIQKEEQEHGELLFDYMSAHGMYKLK